MELTDIAQQLKEDKNDIVLIYAFNSSGKTRLSVEYKNITKRANKDNHAGVYYNAYSEDLFVWDNDPGNAGSPFALEVRNSSLNQFHSFIVENIDTLKDKLKLYNPRHSFVLNQYKDSNGQINPEKGIKSISFYDIDDIAQITPIKISRGEERIFVWCFFWALFEIGGWADVQDQHFFIDDPVSSLDDHNIYITADSLFDIIESAYNNKKKTIITTHHIGLFSILVDRLKKGEKSGRYRNITKIYTLSRKNDNVELNEPNNDVFLFHLHLMKTLHEAKDTEFSLYHFVLLRQLLENISSFLGKGGVSYTLSQIEIPDVESVANTINSLSHKDAYRPQYYKPSPSEEQLMRDLLDKIQAKYKFVF